MCTGCMSCVKYDKTVDDERSFFDDTGFFLQRIHCAYRIVDDSSDVVHVDPVPEKEADLLIIPYCNSA